MRLRLVRSLMVAASFLLPHAARAQTPTTRPTPEQARVLLQTRPDLVAQLRQRFATSGMSREQVHARLRAEGYPEDILDPYLSDATGGAAQPSDSVFAAVLALGIADSSDVAQLQMMGADTSAARGDSPRTRGDSIRSRADSVRQKAQRDSGFTIFGLDIFRSSTSQFQPNAAGPVDASYRLGPGDNLVLILTGDYEASYQLPVTREGFIVVPQVGQIYIANLTLGQLEQVMRSRLAPRYSGIATGAQRFSISVSRVRSNQVFVTGDVQRPGSYVISGAGTALTALYAAGGPTVNGSLRRIMVRRGGVVVDTLDVYDYLVNGDATRDVRLQNGDVLFVPVHGTRARIVGEIIRPATYELKGAETLADLVRFAGGFQPTAARQRVLVQRIVPASQRGAPGGDRTTLDISSNDIGSAVSSQTPLQNGDVVRVFAIAERVRNRVTVAGNVYQPGDLGLTPGMRISDALRSAGGLQPDTYLGEVLISRMRSDSSRGQLRAILADTLGHVVNDLALQEDDSIYVYSVAGFRPVRFVSISGAVNRSGRYSYREGMTMRDLILQANGLDESAYLREAEIARLPETRERGRTASTLRVPLDSTYLFERKPNGGYPGVPGLPAPADGAQDVVLKPYDAVLILRQPGWELQRTVTLNGEVRYPGTYALKNKTERLSDLIARAGGLTDEAYADGILFNRSQSAIGRVGVDLSAALSHYEGSDNLILRDGDNITIPPFNSTVTIRGSVNQPSTVAYVRGRSIDYYISAAGGPSRDADEGRAYVTQPSGKLESVRSRFLLPAQLPEPRPGSIVTVPQKDPADKKDFIAIAGAVASILSALVTTIVLITRRGA